jgi:hypothetical protein
MPLSFFALQARPFAVLALLPASIAGCITPMKVAPVAVERHEWTTSGPDGKQLLTRHFDICTTVRDPVLRDALPDFLETAFAEYARLIPLGSGDVRRLTVYLFDTRQEWVRFTKRFAPAQSYTYLHIHAGGYTDYQTATAVTFDLGRDNTLSLLAHEGFHQYVARYRTEPLPPWLNEGLACQFEAFTLTGPRPTFTPRKNLIRLAALREALATPAGLIPLPELLRMDAGRAVRQVGTTPQPYYAQIWSTVLYLRDRSCPYAAGFRSLLADAGTPRLTTAIRAYCAATPGSETLSHAETAFRQYITPDLDEFTRNYHAFAEKLVHGAK